MKPKPRTKPPVRARSASRLPLLLLLLLAPPGGAEVPGMPLPPANEATASEKRLREEESRRATAEKKQQEAEKQAQAAAEDARRTREEAEKKLRERDEEIRRLQSAQEHKPPPEQRPATAASVAAPASGSATTPPGRPAPGSTLPKVGFFPEMVVLPPGSYRRGSQDNEKERDKDEGPVKTVTIAYSLAVGKYEVSFAEWDACVDDQACPRPDTDWGRGQQPVINVSWNDINDKYLPWLNRKAGYRENDPYRYRLLTEAEWEYAARGVTSASSPHPPFPAIPGGKIREW